MDKVPNSKHKIRVIKHHQELPEIARNPEFYVAELHLSVTPPLIWTSLDWGHWWAGLGFYERMTVWSPVPQRNNGSDVNARQHPSDPGWRFHDSAGWGHLTAERHACERKNILFRRFEWKMGGCDMHVSCTRRPGLHWSSLHMITSNKAAGLTWGQRSGASNALCGADTWVCTCSRMFSWCALCSATETEKRTGSRSRISSWFLFCPKPCFSDTSAPFLEVAGAGSAGIPVLWNRCPSAASVVDINELRKKQQQPIQRGRFFFYTFFDEPSGFLCTEVKRGGEKTGFWWLLWILSGICNAA